MIKVFGFGPGTPHVSPFAKTLLGAPKSRKRLRMRYRSPVKDKIAKQTAKAKTRSASLRAHHHYVANPKQISQLSHEYAASDIRRGLRTR